MSVFADNSDPSRILQRGLAALFTAALVVLLVGGVTGIYADLQCEVYPVVGSVSVDGATPAGAVVKFHRIDSDPWMLTTPTGVVNDDGMFHLLSIGSRPGAPAGDYVITIEWNQQRIGAEGLEAVPNLLPDRFASSTTTPLRAVVEPKATRLSTFELSCRCTEALTRQSVLP